MSTPYNPTDPAGLDWLAPRRKDAPPAKVFTPRTAPLVGSRQQEEFWNEVVHGTSHIVLEATAGSGKSSSIEEAIIRQLKHNPKLYVIVVAFNKHIAEEMGQRLQAQGVRATASTFNSLGYQTVRANLPKAQFKANKLYWVTKDTLGENATYNYCRQIQKLAQLSKCYLLGMVEREGQRIFNLDLVDWRTELTRIAARHEINLNGKPVGGDSYGLGATEVHDLRKACQDVPRVLKACLENTAVVDYDDQIWFTVVYDFPVRTFDVMYTDECFVGDTPILLDENGNTAPIKQLVEEKYSGRVLTYDGTKSVSKRVTGWHKVAVSKPMLRIRFNQNRRTKDGNTLSPLTQMVKYGTKILVCTEDHRIFAGGGWVRARDLVVGDSAIIESCAPRVKSYTPLYKHGPAGLKNLSRLMTSKNNAGTCGQSLKGGVIPSALRGGNGKGPSPVEAALLERLGEGWVWNHVVPTKLSRSSSFPTCYKIDLANPAEMIAIEVDGQSHNSKERKLQDTKKDKLLKGFGWEVIRITNKQAMAMTDEMLNERIYNSPVEAVVVSIDPWIPKDPYVYDITVEDTHCYYADGVLVHNCQDLNALQHAMVKKFAGPNGRVVVAGDSMQSCYGFRGADTKSMRTLTEMLQGTPRGVKQMPLTFTRRCPKSHVRLAQAIVPEIEAMPDAPEGSIRLASFRDAISQMEPGDMVLSRVNAPLAGACFKLIGRGVKAIIRGQKDFVEGMNSLIKKFSVRTVRDLIGGLESLQASEETKHANDKEWAGRLINMGDQIETLKILSEGLTLVEELVIRVEEIFMDFDDQGKPKDAVILSTVHRGKGLESPRVWILCPHLIPHPRAVSDDDYEQETHIAYIAVTRVKATADNPGELIFVGDPKGTVDLEIPEIYG